VSAECLFVDPVADIAVLGPPDDQALEGYMALTEAMVPLRVAELPWCVEPQTGQGALMSLDCQLIACDFEIFEGRALWIKKGVEPAMSGSPILDGAGAAIGVVCSAEESSDDGGANPHLTEHLPRWLLREFLLEPRKSRGGPPSSPTRRHSPRNVGTRRRR